jgi:hypothetical protein
MTIIEISHDQFFIDIGAKIKDQVSARLGWRELTTIYRGNVLEIPVKGIKGCHYEIGLHQDCHEIALHFQGSTQSNASRLDGFRPYVSRLNSSLGYPLILGPHEHLGRKRLWIKLPLCPCTQEIVEKYSDLTARLIIVTYPILKSITDEENRSKTW